VKRRIRRLTKDSGSLPVSSHRRRTQGGFETEYGSVTSQRARQRREVTPAFASRSVMFIGEPTRSRSRSSERNRQVVDIDAPSTSLSVSERCGQARIRSTVEQRFAPHAEF
jgi:hypothetical protein